MTRRPDETDPRVMAYRALVAEGWTCPHGAVAGYVVRPWCGTPACPACRRRDSARWRSVESVQAIPAVYR